MIKKIHRSIEIVSTTNPHQSSLSNESRNAIRKLLSKYYSDVRITIINNLSDLEALGNRHPDLVFLGMKYLVIEEYNASQKPHKVWLGGFLDDRSICYTGSNQYAHKLELYKPLAKECVLAAGLNTAPYIVLKKFVKYSFNNLPANFPLFVKPVNSGGGVGIDSASLVSNVKELKAKFSSISQIMNTDSLVEEYLPGREFSVSIFKKSENQGYFVMPIELIALKDFRGSRILSQFVKASNKEVVLKVTDLSIRSKINSLALQSFHVLGARDYGRFDIRLDANDKAQFLEANLIPSLIANYGSFPKACKINENIDYRQMILGIVNLAFERSRAKEPIDSSQSSFDLISQPALGF